MRGDYKEYIVYFRSRYYPLEGTYRRKVRGPSKKWVRDNWYGLMDGDEYRVVKVEEVK